MSNDEAIDKIKKILEEITRYRRKEIIDTIYGNRLTEDDISEIKDRIQDMQDSLSSIENILN